MVKAAIEAKRGMAIPTMGKSLAAKELTLDVILFGLCLEE